MIVRDNSAVLEKQHYKMYKSGKSWVIAGIATMALGGSMIATGTAHADEVPTAQSAQQTISQPQSSSTLQATNSSEASTQNSGASTSTIANQQSGQLTQPVTVDHSALDQATSNASQSGVLVHQTQTVTKVIPEGQKAQAVKDAENDYAQQAQTINRQVAEYNQQKDNQSKYNGARGDTTKLDDAVKEAQNTPGITVIQDKDQASTVSPTNESVKAFNEHATFNNNEQAKAIQDAIATQKQYNSDYQTKLADYQAAQSKYRQELDDWRKKADVLNPNGVASSEIQQRLTFGREPQAILSIITTDGIRDDNFQYPAGWSGDPNMSLDQLMKALKMDSQSYATIKWKGGVTGQLVVEYSNLKNTSYIDSDGQTKHISKIRVTYNMDSSNLEHGITVFSDITDGFGYLNTSGATATYVLYGEDGKPLDLSNGHAYLTVTSLNNHSQGIESVSSGKNTEAYAILGSSVSNHNGSLYADQNNNPKPEGSWDVAAHNNSGWDLKGPYEYYGAGLIKVTSNNFALHYYVQNSNAPAPSGKGVGPWVTITTDVVATPGPKYEGPEKPTLKTTETHYHYNVAAVQAPSHADATYHLYDLEVPNVQPTKSETDDNGVDINGEALMAGDRVNFGLGWVLTPYKDIDANSDSIHKGFQYVDDYQDDALVPDIDKATITDTVTGQAVTGITLTKWDSLNSAPQTIKDIVAKAGVHPTGAFLLWSANDPESFYKNYVVTGHDLKINLPMTVKTDFSGKLKNQAVQIDFGTGHSTNEVGNEVHKLDPHKDVVVNVGSKQSLNNQDVSLGQVADYELDSSIRPANYGGQTDEWSFTDHVDTVHDQLTGNNKVFAKTSMVLNGHQYNAGDDISSYFDIKQQDGTVTFTAKPEFLAEINKDTNKKVPIQWSGYIQFKRIAAGDVKNTFEESYNHQIVKSNTVTTHTKAPKPTPTPKPKAPIMPSLSREAPKAVVAAVPAPQPSPQAAPQELPQTGNGSQSGVAALGFAGILLSLGALGTKKKVRA